MGPPSEYSTWEDEGLNNALKHVCNKAYRAVWHRRCLLDMNALQRRRFAKRSRDE